ITKYSIFDEASTGVGFIPYSKPNPIKTNRTTMNIFFQLHIFQILFFKLNKYTKLLIDAS
ncbi:hypothetical protein, partial [Leptospira interrogans]|uniref:hypothetical protein n=1 Tax=Leptospira interrogans TaxID=173 RepID=UPI001E2BD115